jgi:hypothetical protein
MEVENLLEKTMVISTRVDPRDLAAIAVWAKNARRIKLTKSNVTSIALEVLAQIVEEQELAERPQSLEEAYEVLARLDLLPSGAYARRVLAQGMSLESGIKHGEISSALRQAKRIYAGSGMSGDSIKDLANRHVSKVANTEHYRQDKQDPEQDPENIGSLAWIASCVDIMKQSGRSQQQIEEVLPNLYRKREEWREQEQAEQDAKIKQAHNHLQQQRSTTFTPEQVEQNKLTSAAEIYKWQVSTAKWTEQEFTEKTLTQAWPQATSEELQTKLSEVRELAVELQPTDEERRATEQEELEEMKRELSRPARGGTAIGA